MKTVHRIATLTILLFAFVLINTAAAQEKPVAKDTKSAVTEKQTKSQGSRFIDENGDGVCDQHKGSNARQKKSGNGSNCGSAHRGRMRDASCGNGTESTSGAVRRGQQRSK